MSRGAAAKDGSAEASFQVDEQYGDTIKFVCSIRIAAADFYGIWAVACCCEGAQAGLPFSEQEASTRQMLPCRTRKRLDRNPATDESGRHGVASKICINTLDVALHNPHPPVR
jgi:hypothetical protein